MPPIPIATFLAGSLLSLLLPVCLLIALAVWYVRFVRHVPDATDGTEPGSTTAPTNPSPTNPSPANPSSTGPSRTPPPEAGGSKRES